MASRGGYGQACAVAHALDMIGERWALLVVRELRLGPRRYVDLQASLPGAGPSVLSQRLRDLERVGVLRRRTLPPPAGSRVYELTEWGADLEPVFVALARWGIRSPVVPLDGDVSADSVLLGMRTFFEAGAAWDATYEVVLERDTYTVRVADGRIAELSRGESTGRADVVMRTDLATFRSLLADPTELKAAVKEGRLTLAGDLGTARRLLEGGRRNALSRG